MVAIAHMCMPAFEYVVMPQISVVHLVFKYSSFGRNYAIMIHTFRHRDVCNISIFGCAGLEQRLYYRTIDNLH